ncbi:MAG TPA: cobyrinic acid a,c-diamide synthase, partial [Methanomicrobiales archaeon]|nr:cobyrinic acid a,c-diamide synthase [Methanomicrobiales archaeon]
LLRHIAVERDEVVILDMEAGVEHFGRGTAEHVDTMLVVTDANARALQAALRIAELSREGGIREVFLVGNMVEDESQKASIQNFAEEHNLRVLGCVAFDRSVREAGILGRAVFEFPEGPAIHALERMRERILKDRESVR